jgi:hypothetical protein
LKSIFRDIETQNLLLVYMQLDPDLRLQKLFLEFD